MSEEEVSAQLGSHPESSCLEILFTVHKAVPGTPGQRPLSNVDLEHHIMTNRLSRDFASCCYRPGVLTFWSELGSCRAQLRLWQDGAPEETQAQGREETCLPCSVMLSWFPLPDACKSGDPSWPDPGNLGAQRLLCWSSWNCIYIVLAGFGTPESHQGSWSL